MAKYEPPTGKEIPEQDRLDKRRKVYVSPWGTLHSLCSTCFVLSPKSSDKSRCTNGYYALARQAAWTVRIVWLQEQRKAWALSCLPCSTPFWTRWVWAEGSPPICSWGWHQSQHLRFLAAAPPTELDRLETQKQRDVPCWAMGNNAKGAAQEEKEAHQRCVLILWLHTGASEVSHGEWTRWDEYCVTHSERLPGCWRWSFPQR